MEHVASLDFYFPTEPIDRNWNQQVITYLVRKWEGDPIETEEMKPQWFRTEEIPYDQMWSPDRYWLPKVLAGEKVKATFLFDDKQEVSEHEIENL